jgi:two-component system response regulator AtoC
MQSNSSTAKEREKKLERDRKKVRTLLELLSTVVHDLRVPLALSIGPLEALLAGECGKVGKGVQDHVGLALRNNRRLLKLANHLLELTRLELGACTAFYMRRDLNQFVTTIVDAFSFMARKKEINLTFAGSDCLTVTLDPEKMERALFNIIGNALKFTPRGGRVTVAVTREKHRTNGGCVDIVVRDNGIGIHQKDLPRIFELFNQADTTRAQKFGGTGIGLFLAKQFVELQGGTLTVDSIYGKGSTFTIRLPIRKGYNYGQSTWKDSMHRPVIIQKEIELSDIGYEKSKIREEKPTGGRKLILFIDDNFEMRKFVHGVLKKEYDVITAENGVKGLAKLRHTVPDLIITDIIMPRMDGLQFLTVLKADPVLKHVPLIVLTAKTDPACKIKGLHKGADDYIVKPINLQELLARIRAHLRIQSRIRERKGQGENISPLEEKATKRNHGHLIVGNSKPMQEICRLINNIRGSESPVLISGETGTGKELVAQTIHRTGKRCKNPFVILDCSVLNKNLLESELFGHVQGAFTGALTDKKGIFELAEGSTILLDEIGEMGLETQVKLLRVLEEGTFRAVGSSEEKRVSVRIVAATNRELHKMVEQGRFREDLYYRINVITINLPPLRERREDIPLLVEYFMKRLNGENGRKRVLAPETLERLIRYSYPGNVRELKNLIERVLMLSENEVIELQDLPREVRGKTAEDFVSADNVNGQTLSQILKRTERSVISHMLKQVKGNKLQAAKRLKISRSTLYTKIEEYKIG